MVEFEQIFVALLLGGLFLFGAVMINITYSQSNGKDPLLLKDPVINKSFNQIATNLSNQQSLADSQREGFERDDPALGTGGFLFTSIIGIGKTFTSSLSNILSVIFIMTTSALGIDSASGAIIFGTITSIFVMIVIFALWRKYKGGS